MTLKATLLLSLVALTASGCSGCGDNVAIEVEEVPEEFSSRFCQSLFTCGSTPSVEACIASFDNSYYSLVTQSIRDGKIIFDGDAAAECFDLLSGDACTERTTGAQLDELFAACTAGFTGTVAAGGDCLLLEECESGNCDFGEGTDICGLGVCAYDSGSGQDCSTTPCSYQAWCDAADNTCKDFVAAGGECVPGSCTYGHRCDPQSNTCVEVADEGQSCAAALGSSGCSRFDNYCDSVTGECTRRVAVGGSCSADDANCVVWAHCNAGTCEALPEGGDGCDPQIGCLGGLRCVGGICTLPDLPTCE